MPTDPLKPFRSYSIIYNDIIRCGKKLTDHEKAIVNVILSYRRKDGIIFLYHSQLAHDLGITDLSHLRRSIRRLKAKNAITVINNRDGNMNKANNYIVNDGFFTSHDGDDLWANEAHRGGPEKPTPPYSEDGAESSQGGGPQRPIGEGHGDVQGEGHGDVGGRANEAHRGGPEKPTKKNELEKRLRKDELKKNEEQPRLSAASPAETESVADITSIQGALHNLDIEDHTAASGIQPSMIQTLITTWQQTVSTLNLTTDKVTACDKLLRLEQTKTGVEINPAQVCCAAKAQNIKFTDLFKPAGTGFVWSELMKPEPVPAAAPGLPSPAASGELSASGTASGTAEPALVSPKAIGKPGRPSRTARPTAKKTAWPEETVLSIYQAYPRRVGRGAALTAIKKALTLIADSEEHDDPVAFLLGQVKKYAASRAGQDSKYTPHPATWVNQLRFMDEIESSTVDRTSRILESDTEGWVPIINQMPEL